MNASIKIGKRLVLAKKEAVVRSLRMRPMERELLRENFTIRTARVKGISAPPQKRKLRQGRLFCKKYLKKSRCFEQAKSWKSISKHFKSKKFLK